MDSIGYRSPHQAALREDAQHKLKAGTAPATQGWGVSVETLALLHRLASSPASAGDALKLLHELQVHQVELDLQHAQLEANERDHELTLARYRAMYESAPFAYFVMAPDSTVHEANLAGASLLGVGRDEANGRRIDSFLAPESREPFSQMLGSLAVGSASAGCAVQLAAGADDAPTLRVMARFAPSREAILVSIAEAQGPSSRGPAHET